MTTDTRECGWMGCGHEACADTCAGTPATAVLRQAAAAMREDESGGVFLYAVAALLSNRAAQINKHLPKTVSPATPERVWADLYKMARAYLQEPSSHWQQRAERAEHIIGGVEAYADLLCDCGDTDNCPETALRELLYGLTTDTRDPLREEPS